MTNAYAVVHAPQTKIMIVYVSIKFIINVGICKTGLTDTNLGVTEVQSFRYLFNIYIDDTD